MNKEMDEKNQSPMNNSTDKDLVNHQPVNAEVETQDPKQTTNGVPVSQETNTVK